MNDESKITEKSWVPLSAACAVVLAVAGGVWGLRGSLADQAEAFRNLQAEVKNGITDINADLDRRTRSRWSYDMESDSWNEFERLNREKGLRIPDTKQIKRDRDYSTP